VEVDGAGGKGGQNRDFGLRSARTAIC
jgi:hypothetical protein